MGITPAILQSVIAGERNITLMKEGYEDYIEKITLKPNETVNKDIKMKKKAGALSIETIPSGAEIYIDGYKKGVSPITVNLIIGKYKVKAIKEDYEDYEKETTIEYKATRKETFNLTEEPGSLLIKVEQSPANVYIDNELKGKADPKLSFEKFPSGEHTVKITKDGYEDYKQTMTIHSNKGETISVVLKKEKEKPKEKYTSSQKYKPSSESKKLPSNMDICLSYRGFVPRNKTFKDIVGNGNGFYVGGALGNYINVGFDFWGKSGLTVSDITELEAKAWELTLTYPFIINENVLVYAGGGGRFESIDVNPTDEGESDATFGNNMGLVTGGVKLRGFADEKKSWGVELNYSISFSAKHTDYNMFRIGLLHGWRE